MSVARRLWQITQALVLLASLAVFLLIAGGFALLVFFAHDARVPFKKPATQDAVSGTPERAAP